MSDDKRLAEEIARLDRLEEEGRQRFSDPKLTINDLAAIRQVGQHFGVTDRAAYLRAKDLGLLSYQDALPKQEQG